MWLPLAVCFVTLPAWICSLEETRTVELDSADIREVAQESLDVSEEVKAIGLAAALLPHPETRRALEEIHRGELESAYNRLKGVLLEFPCDPHTLEGLEAIGLVWTHQEDRQKQTLALYELLYTCKPDNPDILFYLGKHLVREGQLGAAECILKQCLALAPQYGDAEVQLGYVYMRENRLDEAERMFARHLDDSDAQQGLANLYHREGKEREAQALYRQVLAKDPNNVEARAGLAQSLVANMQFDEANIEYAELVCLDPKAQYRLAWSDVRSRTSPAFSCETFFTDAKENDPSVGVPVVKDYYFLNAVHLLFPVCNRLRLDLKQLYYHQREDDIYPPVGINYSAYLLGGQITSSYWFTKEWQWDVTARGFQAWGRQDVNYPFSDTTRFEPGTNLRYNSEWQMIFLDAHIESFIIKNFAQVESQLLRTDFLTAAYGYHVPCSLHPGAEVWFSRIFIYDNLHNWENTFAMNARCGVPWVEKWFTALYHYEHNHYDQLNPNYYSFQKQIRNVAGIQWHYDFCSRGFLEALYEHRWETTYQLFQPIGNFIFVDSLQFLTANRITGRCGYRCGDQLRFEVGGHYFRTTLPYRDWNINSSVLWQF